MDKWPLESITKKMYHQNNPSSDNPRKQMCENSSPYDMRQICLQMPLANNIQDNRQSLNNINHNNNPP